ncbi:MAG TPA: YidC/Oxa1 family membrane protein insertase [Acidimicrobiia bacterium]|nr:YidC/Oxa1 family membrane protein insertase [Acidimicrobiia bacterium]
MSAIWNGLQDILGGTLSFFYGLIPNFGVAIILLTIAIGVILFPLTLKQTRSMKAMQEIQPEIKRIQKELKHDRQAQMQATQELYRERGVNPAAGCLPLLLQMPIWFALFSVLRNPGKWVTGSLSEAVATGNTGFLGMDLGISPSDAWSIGFVDALPYLLTIALVVATAYWQQRQLSARNTAQGQQQPGQAIMKIFPLFFGFISFNLPAGLVVYFAASQAFRIGQQSLILGLDERDQKRPPTKGRTEGDMKQSRPNQDSPGASKPSSGGTQPSPHVSKKKRGKKRRRK